MAMRQRIRKLWPWEWRIVPVAWEVAEPNFTNTRTNSHTGMFAGLRLEPRRVWRGWR